MGGQAENLKNQSEVTQAVKHWRWIWWALGFIVLLFIVLLSVRRTAKERARTAYVSPPAQSSIPFPREMTFHEGYREESGTLRRFASTPTSGFVARRLSSVSPTTTSPITLTAVRKVAPDRHLIKTATVTVETDDVGLTVQRAIALAKEKGGYVFSLSEQISPTGQHSAMLEIRVPSDAFEETLLAIERLGKIRNKSVRAEDVTEEFLDIQSRLKALRESEKRILKMLSEAEDLDTVFKLENELAVRRSEIERLEGRLRYLQERTTFSSINLTITEFRVVATPPETWAAIKVAADAWRELVKVLRVLATVGIWLAVWSVLWLPILLIAVFASRFAISRLRTVKASETGDSS